MPSILFRLLLTLGIFLVLDIYAYQAVRVVTRDGSFWRYLYWGFTAAVVAFFILQLITYSRAEGPSRTFFYLLGVLILIYVPKLVIVLPLLVEDLSRLVEGAFIWLGEVTNLRPRGPEPEGFLPDRRKFVSQLALGMAAIPFLGILHGILIGRYNFRVIRQTLYFPDLPDAFDGFTLVQISDVHSGSFDNREKIEYAIDLINEQDADTILFTGDLVNNRATEIEPWKDVFARLKAPHGKFSILGNHDYGDYVGWPNRDAKEQNLRDLYQHHADMGFDLLRNETRFFEKDGQRIALLGVENWGAPPFPQYGDLNRCLSGCDPVDFKILMSHDPTHFDHVVKSQAEKVHLTLSGHTHGMQFGIEIPGVIKWSPVQWRYKKWAGLYEEMGRYLYVNRGFGFLAFPGRVGIWPEITRIELRKGEVRA